jgi:hypothetical protein
MKKIQFHFLKIIPGRVEYRRVPIILGTVYKFPSKLFRLASLEYSNSSLLLSDPSAKVLLLRKEVRIGSELSENWRNKWRNAEEKLERRKMIKLKPRSESHSSRELGISANLQNNELLKSKGACTALGILLNSCRPLVGKDI